MTRTNNSDNDTLARRIYHRSRRSLPILCQPRGPAKSGFTRTALSPLAGRPFSLSFFKRNLSFRERSRGDINTRAARGTAALSSESVRREIAERTRLLIRFALFAKCVYKRAMHLRAFPRTPTSGGVNSSHFVIHLSATRLCASMRDGAATPRCGQVPAEVSSIELCVLNTHAIGGRSYRPA